MNNVYRAWPFDPKLGTDYDIVTRLLISLLFF